jgi:hypothetical protein
VNVVRVSILTLPPEHLDEATAMMVAAEDALADIKQMKGHVSYFVGVDRETCQFVNVSFWETTEDANQMSSFQPMLDLAGQFVAFGATFLRPIPNFELLWQWGSSNS